MNFQMKRIKKTTKAILNNKKLKKYINPKFIIIGAISVVGVITLLMSSAATPSLSLEPESGQLAGCAKIESSAQAANQKAVKFGCDTPPSTNSVYGAQLPIQWDIKTLSGSVKYVAPNGNDGGSGNIDSPYSSLNKALSSVSSGGTIVMRGGVYRGQTNVGVSKTVRIIAYPGEIPELRGSTALPSASSGGGWNSEGNYKWRSYTPRPVKDGSGIPFSSGMQNLAGDGVGRYPDQVWIGDTSSKQVINKSELSDGKFWADRSNNRLYLTANDANKSNIESSRSSSGSSDVDRAIRITSPNVRIEGIKITRYSNNANDYGVLLADIGSSNFVAKNVYITDSAYISVTVNQVDNVTAENVTVTRSNWMGFSPVQTDNFTLKNSKVSDMNYASEFTADPQSGAIKASKTRHTRVIGSLIANNKSHGLWYDDSNTDAEIINSAIVDNTASGVFWEISDGILVANSYFRSKGSREPFSAAGSSGIKLINNTMVGGANPIAVYTDGRSAPNCPIATYPFSACLGGKGGVWSSNRLSEPNPNPPPEFLPRGDEVGQTRFGRRKSLDWMPRIDLMINNIAAYPTTSRICGGIAPLCITTSHGSGANAPIQTVLHKANSPWPGLPQTLVNGNVYATNQSNKALIYIHGTKYTDLTTFRNTMAGSPVGIGGMETNGLQGTEYVNQNGTPTQKLIDKYSNAVPVPTDSTLNQYIPAGTKRYGTSIDISKF